MNNLLHKFFLTFLFALGSVFVFGQANTITAKVVNITQSIYITGHRADSISLDGTFSSNSDNVIPSQKAVKTYVDSRVTLDSIQVITSGGAVTLNNGVNIVYVDPTSTLSNLTITGPAIAHLTRKVTFYFGGVMTTGTVVTLFSFVANSGQSLLQASSPSAISAGDFPITYKFRPSTTKWYRDQ